MHRLKAMCTTSKKNVQLPGFCSWKGRFIMAVNGIGSVHTYIYHIDTGKLSTKDGSQDDFVDYFNGDLNGKHSDTLNGFDQRQKYGIENIRMLYESQKCAAMFSGGNANEIEITSEVADVTTTRFTINGEKVLTAYDMCTFSYVDDIMADELLYRTRNSKPYDSSDNSVNIAVGDVFDLGNGYQLTVQDDHIQIDGLGRGNEDMDQKVQYMAYGLHALIRFADQQWMSEMIDPESTPMILDLLREIGVDTEKKFIINGTECEIRHGRIREAGNKFGIPSSIFQEAQKKYEELLYTPLSQRENLKA